VCFWTNFVGFFTQKKGEILDKCVFLNWKFKYYSYSVRLFATWQHTKIDFDPYKGPFSGKKKTGTNLPDFYNRFQYVAKI
jgi:hypothetical protein